MTNPPTNKSLSKSKALLFLEYVVLALCLSVMALRATFTEGPAVISSMLPSNVSDNLYSLSISALLIFAFVLWFVWSFCSRRFIYRFTGMEIGLGIFLVAAVIAGLAAPDKRLAITNVITFVAPVLMALLLVQILDSNNKVKLLLCIIGALGLVTAYQCSEQFFVSNQMTIEQYEENPEAVLQPLGIEPGTIREFLFEHRLYTRGVSGFFTTRNSAGSFLLMASFAAVALFIEKFRNRKSKTSRPVYIFAAIFVTAVIIFGLALTKSKGAIIGWLFAAAVFILYLALGNRLKNHGRAVFLIFLLIAVAGGLFVVWYGLNHGRLPGGNSMLVRWQYWRASAQMYADHPLTGVGPGNFGHFYFRYKPASALESVSDPHNFLLSLLTQYGPLGLIGFVVMLFVPLWRVVSPNPSSDLPMADRTGPSFRNLFIIFLVIISALIFSTRPVWMPTSTENLALVLYMILRFYIPPVAVFIVGFLILADPLRDVPGAKSEIRNSRTAAVLFCALLGVMLHNLTDFAIFEPGVFTAFCAILASLIAVDHHQKSRPCLVISSSTVVKILIIGASALVTWAYFTFALIPTAKSTTAIRQANQAILHGRFGDAHRFLDRAAEDDALSSDALTQNGRLYLHQFELSKSKNKHLLTEAAKCFQAAIKRDNVVYKNYEQLTEVYRRLAELSSGQEKTNWLNKAFDSASLAIEHYPGSGRLHFELAQIAEQQGKNDVALKEYKKAIEIEDEYRAQFRRMYPEREKVVSRIGEDRYQLAKEKVKLLSGQPSH